MGDGPSQRVPLWSQLDMWHRETTTSYAWPEGRYEYLPAVRQRDAVCRLCGCRVHENYIASHDAYHEEQGY